MNRYPTKKAIDSLIEKLELPKHNVNSQDWEYEVSDSSRVNEFIEFYNNGQLNDDEKFVLLMIIIGSCNDALEEGAFDDNVWEKVKGSIIKDKHIHYSTIDYWSLDGEDYINCFEITPLIRAIKNKW